MKPSNRRYMTMPSNWPCVEEEPAFTNPILGIYDYRERKSKRVVLVEFPYQRS